MPMRKAPGPDDITTEMLVAAGGRGVMEITNLANMMYSEGGFPEQMYKSIFITIPKVNDNDNEMTMKYFILTEKQCNIINQKCIKLKYCHGDHIKTKKIVDRYDHQCC